MTRRKHCRKDKNFLVNFRCRGEEDDLKWLPLRSSHVQRKNYFKFRNSGKSADFPELPFHGRGRGGKRHLQRRFLRKRGAAGKFFASFQRAEPSQSSLRDASSPERGSFISANRQMTKAPPSGELANAVSLRGLPSPWGKRPRPLRR